MNCCIFIAHDDICDTAAQPVCDDFLNITGMNSIYQMVMVDCNIVCNNTTDGYETEFRHDLEQHTQDRVDNFNYGHQGMGPNAKTEENYFNNFCNVESTFLRSACDAIQVDLEREYFRTW